MVKHQRRSHQRGIHSSELDDCTSESGSDESPSTPKSNAMQWPPQGVPINPMPHGHGLHRAASFADFGQHMNQYNMPQYGHRHTLSGGPHEFHGQAVHEQHSGMPMLHRTASLPQHSYYVTEQNNPGVATMNKAPMPAQYSIPRQPVERIAVEIPYTAPGLTGSIQSSPSSFSALGCSSSTQDGFYTHQPTQAATYALHAAPATSRVEQQAPILPYSQQMAQQVPPPQQMPTSAPQQSAGPSPDEHYQPAPPAEGAWYDGVQYQPPMEVPQMGQMATYGSAVYEAWADPKIEFETAGIPMPSARIAQMQ